MTRHVHLTLKDALEQKRMKEFMAQYKGIKASGGEIDKRATREGNAPQPRRRKGQPTR